MILIALEVTGVSPLPHVCTADAAVGGMDVFRRRETRPNIYWNTKTKVRCICTQLSARISTACVCCLCQCYTTQTVACACALPLLMPVLWGSAKPHAPNACMRWSPLRKFYDENYGLCAYQLLQFCCPPMLTAAIRLMYASTSSAS